MSASSQSSESLFAASKAAFFAFGISLLIAVLMISQWSWPWTPEFWWHWYTAPWSLFYYTFLPQMFAMGFVIEAAHHAPTRLGMKVPLTAICAVIASAFPILPLLLSILLLYRVSAAYEAVRASR